MLFYYLCLLNCCIDNKNYINKRIYKEDTGNTKAGNKAGKIISRGLFGKDEKRMSEFQDFLNEQLQDDDFRKEWEDIQPEMDVIRAMVDARISQNLTQKELADRTGINQADISKLENGTRNPSLKLLKRLAEGMGMTLKLEFIPKHPAGN